jgi:hypothetical protein
MCSVAILFVARDDKVPILSKKKREEERGRECERCDVDLMVEELFGSLKANTM